MHATKEVNRGLSDTAANLQRIDEVLRLSRSAVWEVDLDGTFTYVSPSFEDLLGYRPEELVGRRTIHDFYAPDLPEDLCAELSPEWIANGDEFTEMAIPLVAKSGKIVWISSSGTPIRDVDGRITGSRGVDTDITALKQAEENVRASERALWRQMQEAPMAMAFTDLSDVGALHVNRAFVRIFGYEAEEIPTIDAWFARSYPDPVDREKVERDTQEWMAQAARGEVLQPREYRLTCRDGRVLDVEIAAAVVAGRFVGTFTDVTLRRRELELRKLREEELRRVLDNLPFPVATSVAGKDFDWQDPRAEVTYLNRRFTERFGFTLEDIPTVSAWACRAFPDETKRHEVFAVLEQQVQTALRGEGAVGPVEVSITGRDGDMRDVLLQAVAAGNQLVISLEDTTERKQARRRLEESESSLRALIDNAPVGVVRLHLPSGRLWLNKEFTGLLGYTEADVPTMEEWMARAYPDEVYRREIMARWQRDLAEASGQGGRLAPSEVRVTDKAGNEHEMQFSAVIMGEEVFGLWVDLTARNRAERLSRERQEQLARVGRVSTLGQLAASLAHELDQPLGAILNNAEAAHLVLARETPDLAELRAIVEDILADDRRAGAVLDRIRGMVRQRAFKAQAVPVESLLQEVARLVRPLAASQQIAWQISCEPGTPAIDGDAVLLQQALLNLGLNAVEAIGDRKDGRIEIRAGEAGHGMVEIGLTDNGGGVPRDKFASLFEPFYTTKRDGLGMGLPLVRSIAEEHGGRVRLDNQPGRGLAVYLRLPARRP